MKRICILAVMMAMVFGLSLQAQAALQNLGTDSLGNRLIYDTDFNITWYDFRYTSSGWDNAVAWADALSVTFGSNTYTDWRLPTALNQDGSGPCQSGNCTGSELGHLWYTELGGDWSSGLHYFGDFQSIVEGAIYWSSTTVAGNTNLAWDFDFGLGRQGADDKGFQASALVVRPGLAVMPEPMSVILFGVGGVVLAARKKLSRRRHG